MRCDGAVAGPHALPGLRSLRPTWELRLWSSRSTRPSFTEAYLGATLVVRDCLLRSAPFVVSTVRLALFAPCILRCRGTPRPVALGPTPLPKGTTPKGGRRSRGGRAGGGCVPEMAEPDFPNCKMHFFPRRSLWLWGGGGPGGGSPPPPPPVYGHCNTSLVHTSCPRPDVTRHLPSAARGVPTSDTPGHEGGWPQETPLQRDVLRDQHIPIESRWGFMHQSALMVVYAPVIQRLHWLGVRDGCICRQPTPPCYLPFGHFAE